jgi:hypothetical protein
MAGRATLRATSVFRAGAPIVRRLFGMCLVPLAALLLSNSPAFAAEINSGGPLTWIQTSPDLNCAVNYAGDSHSEFFGTTACATLVAVDGTLYGPASIPAGGSASPRTSWSTDSQVFSGVGTAMNPYRIVTVVAGGGLKLTQTDTYVEGSESYGTRVEIANETGSTKTVTLYRAADCYLQDSDFGYGAIDPLSGSVACTAGAEAGSRIEQWAPLTPGSHYYETFYGTLWAHIGSQSPLPDSCDCDTYQDNSAGLSWTTAIPGGSSASFSHLTAFSPTGQQVEDSDGDGFPDTWEEPSGGVDTSGDGIPDLKLSDFGATPDKPDVFVQVGWTKTRTCFLLFFCSTRNRRPSLAALRDVQNAFDDHGVRLHIDAGPGSLMNPDTGALWGSRSRAGDGINAPSRIAGQVGNQFNWGAAFTGYRASLLPANRSRLFHFMLYVGSFNNAGNSGLARRGGAGFAGSDAMLAYDVPVFGGDGPNRIQESGTFMHELGHNLGLSHGGAETEAFEPYKPNYPSVMNYFWQLSGTFKSSQLGLLDYSEGTLSAITESSLQEPAGLEPDSAALDIATMWWCPNGSRQGPRPSQFNVDWNCNGHIDSGSVSANVDGAASPGLSTLRDHDDWTSLVFDGGGTLGGAGDPGASPDETPVEEPDSNELEEASPEVESITLSGPGQLSIQAHTSAPIPLTIANPHPESRIYHLSTSSEGVNLTGLPANVKVESGESRTLAATLTAGAADENAFFEVDASSAAPTDADSAITEVMVVNQPVSDQPGVTHDAAPIGAPPPGPSIAIPSGSTRSPLRCKKHFKKKKVHGRAKCVRARKHRHRHHRSSR